MTDRQTCVDPKRLVRLGDPETSHAAAARSREFVASHNAAILGTLYATGGLTIHEIGARSGLDPVAVARRMGWLEDQHLVAPSSETRLSPSGRACRVWRLL